MRVLLIDVNCKYSSTGKIVYDLFQKLQEDGHEVAICYGRGQLIKESGIYKFGLDWETSLHAGLARVTGMNGYYSYFSTRRLIKFIEKFEPDVIHIHELHAYFVNIKPLIKYIKAKGIKTIWTFHCEYMYTGKCGHAYECTRFLQGCGKCPAVNEYPKSLVFDRTKKMFHDKKQLLEDWDFTIVTPSQWLADRVKMSFLKNKKIKVIHNGIDTDSVFYSRSGEEIEKLKKRYGIDRKKIVLSVAPDIMNERKGGKLILELSKKVKSDDLQFILVGADETQKYSNNVQLISKTKNQNELAIWYSAANIFLICSKRENFPTTCLEAFCCGTPVVGIDEGGTRETVPEPYGIFVKDCQESKILEAISKQLERNFEKEEVCQKGRALYSKNVMYQNYLKIYRNKE